MNSSSQSGGSQLSYNNNNQVNSNNQMNNIFCPINYYSKLTEERISNLIDNQTKLRLVGKTLIKMHSNLCDRHELFIETHQSICTICNKFIDKFENLILKEEKEEEEEEQQKQQKQQEKVENEIEEKKTKKKKMKVNDEIKSNLKSKIILNNELNDKDVVNCRQLDCSSANSDDELNMLVNLDLRQHFTSSTVDRDKNKCHYCKEIELNNLNIKNIRNYFIQSSNQTQQNNNVQISNAQSKQQQSFQLDNNLRSTISSHKRFHSDSFIKLKPKSNGFDEQVV